MDNNQLLRDVAFVKSRIEILDCINHYARGMDRLDENMTRAAFHDDAVLDYGVFVGNPSGFIEYFYDLHRRFHAGTNHMICNHVCLLEGDTAHTETYFAVANNNHHEPAFALAGGRYIDRFERRAGRWAIAVRKCIPEWNASAGVDLVEKITAVMRGVGTASRDRSDVSYQRPATVVSDRLGISIPM